MTIKTVSITFAALIAAFWCIIPGLRGDQLYAAYKTNTSLESKEMWWMHAAALYGTHPDIQFAKLINPYLQAKKGENTTLNDFLDSYISTAWRNIQNNPSVSASWGQYWVQHWSNLLIDPSDKAYELRQFWYSARDVSLLQARTEELQAIENITLTDKNTAIALLKQWSSSPMPTKTSDRSILAESLSKYILTHADMATKALIEQYMILVESETDTKTIQTIAQMFQQDAQIRPLFIQFFRNNNNGSNAIEALVRDLELLESNGIRSTEAEDVLMHQELLEELQHTSTAVNTNKQAAQWISPKSMTEGLRRVGIYGSEKEISMQGLAWAFRDFSFEEQRVHGIFSPKLQLFTELTVGDQTYTNVPITRLSALIKRLSTSAEEPLMDSAPSSITTPETVLRQRLVRDIFTNLGIQVRLQDIIPLSSSNDIFQIKQAVIDQYSSFSGQYTLSTDIMTQVIIKRGREQLVLQEIPRDEFLYQVQNP